MHNSGGARDATFYTDVQSQYIFSIIHCCRRLTCSTEHPFSVFFRTGSVCELSFTGPTLLSNKDQIILKHVIMVT